MDATPRKPLKRQTDVTRVNITLPAELFVRFREACLREQRPYSQVIAEMIERRLKGKA